MGKNVKKKKKKHGVNLAEKNFKKRGDAYSENSSCKIFPHFIFSLRKFPCSGGEKGCQILKEKRETNLRYFCMSPLPFKKLASPRHTAFRLLDDIGK